MPRFAHQRHKPPTQLARMRELVIACPPLKSNVNLSRIVRTAGCCGVPRIVCCSTSKVLDRIARDGTHAVEIETHRSLPPVLRRLRDDGYALLGLEQAEGSACLYDFRFPRRAVLAVGHERNGLGAEVLELVDEVIEIPVYGLPYSHNVATAATMAMYEYCRQYPSG